MKRDAVDTVHRIARATGGRGLFHAFVNLLRLLQAAEYEFLLLRGIPIRICSRYFDGTGNALVVAYA